MQEPRLSIVVQTSDGRRVGIHLDLPHRQVPMVATMLRAMADRLDADEQKRAETAPAISPGENGRS